MLEMVWVQCLIRSLNKALYKYKVQQLIKIEIKL